MHSALIFWCNHSSFINKKSFCSNFFGVFFVPVGVSNSLILNLGGFKWDTFDGILTFVELSMNRVNQTK